MFVTMDSNNPFVVCLYFLSTSFFIENKWVCSIDQVVSMFLYVGCIGQILLQIKTFLLRSKAYNRRDFVAKKPLSLILTISGAWERK